MSAYSWRDEFKISNANLSNDPAALGINLDISPERQVNIKTYVSGFIEGLHESEPAVGATQTIEFCAYVLKLNIQEMIWITYEICKILK